MEVGLKVYRKPLVYSLDLGFLNPSTNQKTQGEEGSAGKKEKQRRTSQWGQAEKSKRKWEVRTGRVGDRRKKKRNGRQNRDITAQIIPSETGQH